MIDWPTLFNWIAQAAIDGSFGLLGGVVGVLLAHRLTRKHDESKWQRELQAQREALETQFRNELALLERQSHDQRMQRDLDNLRRQVGQ